MLDQDLDAAFEKFGNDPAALQKAFGEIYKAHQGDVYPEIQTDYDTAFYKRTQAMMEAAQKGAAERQREAARAVSVDRTSQIEDLKERRLAALDPSSPAAADEVSRLQRQADDGYDEQVVAGAMTPEEAAAAKARSRRGAAVGFYQRQADALGTPEDVAAMRERMKADFAAGKLPGVDGDAWRDLDGKLSVIEDRKRTDGRQAARALDDRGQALAERVAKGYEPPQSELATFQADAAKAPEGLPSPTPRRGRSRSRAPSGTDRSPTRKRP